jgi:hypothetical protein
VGSFTLKNAVFWDVTRVALVRTNVSEEYVASIIRVTRIAELGTTLAVISNVFLRSVLRLLVTAKVVRSSQILVTLMMEATRSSETSVFTRVTRRNLPDDGMLHSYRRENIKSYIALLYFTSVNYSYSVALSPQANYTD